MTPRPILALALAAAACSSQTVGQAFDLKTPVSLVPFNGYTRYDPGLHGYVAVASMQGDELRVFDPLENRAVSSPGFSFALSVPTDPRPVLLASASLGDATPAPDLLVVASAGEQSLQLVQTWAVSDPAAGMHVVSPSIDLSGLADPGTEIVAMMGIPSFVAGTTQVEPGKARILVAFSRAAGSPTAKLATVEFQRNADGSVGPLGSPRAVAAGFEAVSLSAVAENGVFGGTPVPPASWRYRNVVFAATPDIVTGTDGRSARGVAELDVGASDPTLWSIKAVDARAPTRLVAAAVVGERQPDTAVGFATEPQPRVFSAATLRVYADLDPAGCGPTQPIACGIATLDPLANPPGLVPDIVANGAPGPVFVPNQTYRAPIALPGVSLAMAVALPSANLGTGQVRCDPGYAGCAGLTLAYQADDGASLLRLAPLTGQQWTTGAMVVASSTGSSYVIDLGSAAASNDISLLNLAATKVQATNGRVIGPAGYVASDATPALGLWDSQGTPTDTSTDPTVIDRSIQVTPGFTRDDDWTLTWQGALPEFALRPAVVGRAGGVVYVAFEAPKTDPVGNVVGWSSSTNLSDPALGIHVLDGANPVQEPGDVVEVSFLDGTSRCLDASGNPVLQDTRAVAFLPPAPALPPSDPASAPGGALSLGPAVPACIDPGAADGSHYQALVSVRGFGLVLVGARTGYAGRPALDGAGPSGSAAPSALKWEDEAPLVAACSPASRASCERLSVVRKARRFHYPVDRPCAKNNLGCYGSATLEDPMVPGPALAFRVGKNPAGASGAVGRGVILAFSTLSGVSPMSRVPLYESVPNAAIAVDRSVQANGAPSSHVDEGTWFYVTYTGNTVFGFGPGLYVGTAVSLR